MSLGFVGNVEIAEAINIKDIPVTTYLTVNVDREIISDVEQYAACPVFETLTYHCKVLGRNCEKLHERDSCPLAKYEYIKIQIRKGER